MLTVCWCSLITFTFRLQSGVNFICKHLPNPNHFQHSVLKLLNPLTPMPALAFFRFWRHHFWPKLASSMLNFCRRRRSFQWCPDQSDRLNGAWDMHKNAQKVERKTQTKICRHYTWLLHAKNCPFQWRFLRSFLTASKPSRRSIIAAKRKMEKKERRK